MWSSFSFEASCWTGWRGFPGESRAVYQKRLKKLMQSLFLSLLSTLSTLPLLSPCLSPHRVRRHFMCTHLSPPSSCPLCALWQTSSNLFQSYKKGVSDSHLILRNRWKCFSGSVSLVCSGKRDTNFPSSSYVGNFPLQLSSETGFSRCELIKFFVHDGSEKNCYINITSYKVRKRQDVSFAVDLCWHSCLLLQQTWSDASK